MTDIETVEALNAEQFATATDRILFRARGSHGRLSANKALFARDARRPSDREIAPIPSLVRAAVDDLSPERTLYVRAKKFSTSTTSAAVLATVFAIALVITNFV